MVHLLMGERRGLNPRVVDSQSTALIHMAFIAIFTFIRVRILLLLLCLLLLDANNYDSWSRSMLTALSAKNKVEFVDGSAPQPSSSDPLFNVWRPCNNMVVSWLVHSVFISIRHSILWMDRADEIWKLFMGSCCIGPYV